MKYATDVIDSQFTDWESFDCGDPRLSRKLVHEAALADKGFQKLHGIFPFDSETDLIGVMTVRTGQLQAPPEDVARLAQQTGVTIPSLHIEVLAIRRDWQGKGAGQELIASLVSTAQEIHRDVGLYCLSLEATDSSVPFYQRLGFEASDLIYDDGSRAMWLII